jgi:cytochrome c biogenesis protein CcmG, thiol:disulfide interchange protein DsbE
VRRDRRAKRVAIVASIGLVAFIAYAVVAAATRHPATFPTAPPASRLVAGKHAPPFTASRLGGGPDVRYFGRSSQPVVLNFFASWCTDCVAELNAFASVARHSGGALFLGVDSEDPSPTTAEQLLHRAGISYSVAVDASGAIANRYLVAALPVTFFVRANGTVQATLFGTATPAALRAGLARLEGRG